MRSLLVVVAAIAVVAGTTSPAAAQAIRTGPEANEYLFAYYALDDLTREFAPQRIDAIKKQQSEQFYADRFGALFHKRRLLVNQLQRRSDVMKQDPNLQAAIEQAQGLMKHVGAYQAKLREAQEAYDLGFRAIQAKLFTDAELREKLIQSFIDAEQVYIDKVGSTAPGGYMSERRLRGLTYSLKRRAVAEYRLAKNRQKLAEDVHEACLKYEAENRPALEAKTDSIHQEFMRDYDQVRQKSCADITAKLKLVANKMNLPPEQIVLSGASSDADWTKVSAGREKDPFRLIAQARTMKVESSEEARQAHQFAQECLKALEWIPSGDPRDTSEVFFYYRGLLVGWAGTLATKAAAIQIGTDSLAKCYGFPADSAGTALYAWRLYRPYEKAGAFSKSHALVNNVYAHAYAGKVQEALKLAKDSEGERVGDPNYFYILARLCSIYKFGNQRNIESFYERGCGYMREAMLLGFTGMDEAKVHPDFENMKKNSRIAAKLNQAMFEPDNLFKLTKIDRATRK